MLRRNCPGQFLAEPMRAPDPSPSSANPSSAKSELRRREPGPGGPILDPRDGDAEDDASSPKQKSLMAIAGGLLAEISLTKLLLAWIASILLPAAILGVAPLVATAWVGDVFIRVLELTGIGAGLALLAVSSLDGSAGARCFARPRRISGRSTRSGFSRDTPSAARRSAISRNGFSSQAAGRSSRGCGP